MMYWQTDKQDVQADIKEADRLTTQVDKQDVQANKQGVAYKQTNS